VTRALAPRVVAELLGTATLVAIGTGTIVTGAATGTLSDGTLALGWFLAVALPLVVAAPISGGHLNPAVTALLTLRGRFPAREVPGYLAAQLVGAFLGSALVELALGNGAHLGAALPPHGDLVGAFGGELLGSLALLVTVVYLDSRGRRPTGLELLLPAIAVGGATFLFGLRWGLSLNPFRTLAPAVLSGAYAGFWVFFLTAFVAAVGLAALLRVAVPRPGG
jgi:glycerol uptake facilitator-like aquaporin